jgi:outer membrane protein assembly factor BamB
MAPIEEPDGGDTLNSLAKRLAWVTPTMSDTSEMSIKRVAANQDKVVCVRSKDGFENTVFAMDVKTGKIMWEWGDPNVPSGLFITSLIIKDDLVIVELWADIYILDLNTGQTKWQNIVYNSGICGQPRISVIDDQIYYTLSDCSAEERFNFLMRTPVSHFAPDTVFKIYQITTPSPDSGWITGMQPPQLWKHPTSGDSILLIQARAFKLGVLKNKVDLYAFNLRTREVLWTIDSIAPEGNSSVQPFEIDKNEMYFCGMRSLMKIDLLTGKVVWRYPFLKNTELTALTSPLDVGDKILIHPAGDILYAIDKGTGSKLWSLEDIGLAGPNGKLALNGDIVNYLSSPEFYDINHKTLEILQHSKSPNIFRGYPADFQQFANTVQIPNSNLMFVSDKHFCMLIKGL